MATVVQKMFLSLCLPIIILSYNSYTTPVSALQAAGMLQAVGSDSGGGGEGATPVTELS